MTLPKKQFIGFFKNHILAIILLALFFTASSIFWTTDIVYSQAELKTESLNFGWPMPFVEQGFAQLDPPESFFPHAFGFGLPQEYGGKIDGSALMFSWTINAVLLFLLFFAFYRTLHKPQPLFRFLSVKWIFGVFSILLLIFIIFIVIFFYTNKQPNINMGIPPEIPPQNILQDTAQQITSFEECKKAGFPIMESYPEKCSDSTNFFVR